MIEPNSAPRLLGRARRALGRAPVRYLFALAMVGVAFGLRMLLARWTGKGAPFVLFFGAMLLTNLLVGVGPSLVVLLVSLPIAALNFAVPGGATANQAAFQALLYGLDGLAIIYLTRLTQVAQRRLERANGDLRQAAENFRTAEARTRDIIELSPDAYFQATLGGRLVDVNQAACRSLGYERDELVGKNILDIVPREDAERLEAVKQEVLTPGTVNRGEWVQRRKDGTTILVDASVNIIPDGRWQAFVRDIGDRKRAEAERQRTTERLRQSEEQFRLIFEEAPIGVALAALDGRFVRVNRALCDILGYSREELERLSYQEITPPEDLPTSLKHREQVLRGEVPRYQLEKRYVRKDGTLVDISVNGSMVSGPNGEPLHYIAQIEDITERKRAEATVRQSEAKFRRLVESMPDGVLIHRDGRIVYANRSFGGLLGYDDEATLRGRPVDDLVAPEELPVVRARRRRVLEEGEAAPPQEVTLLRRGGSRQVVESVAMGAEFEGAPAVLVVVRDLTERIRAEEALRFSEAKFSGIVSISADAIISVDESERITVFNTGAEKVFGYAQEEMLGAPLELLIPKSARAGHRHDLTRFVSGDLAAPRTADRLAAITGRRKSGEEFPAEASISSLRVGETRLLTIVLRDVTDREQLEREQSILADLGVALAATLDYDQTLATVAQIAVREFADWCIVEVMEASDGMRRLKVVSADPSKAAIAERLESVQLDRDRPHLTRAVLASRQSQLVTHFTEAELEAAAQSPEHLRILRAVAPASLMSVPLTLRDELIGSLTFLSSRPSRLYGPSDLRLARSVGERASSAIENARLYRSALHATGLRDQVLSVVAHDLRNPLSTIMLHASALQARQGQAERRNPRHREAIERSARRMNRLIQDLLDVALLEAGRLKIDRAPLQPREVVAEAAEMQQALASTSSIELRTEVAPDAPQIFGDRDRLLQVFENLIGNALKFTESGGQVTVGAAATGSGTLFWVTDTGRGMTREEQGQAFDRFWQASARSGRLGAGLGLPITKGIVEAHGGRIWVESTPGQGSTFFFSLPAAAPLEARPGTALH
jgi:PAS domain S-box-containing protein